MINKNVYFTTLGCSKNDVDTDSMRSILEGEDYNTVFSPEESDVIVVNTCGFIEDAKQESIDEIFNMVSEKNKNNQKLVVSGCLAQRYPDELMAEIPEIDGILGTGEIENIGDYIKILESGRKFKEIGNLNSGYTEGLYKTEVKPTEYIKIGEGCNNFCSYCIIPKLRGKNRSRRIENIYREIEKLVEKGTKEVILIAQNTTDYGIDLYDKYSLSELLNELEKIKGLKWIRVLYLYPDNFTEDLIQSFKNNKKLLPYVDIPLQHVNNEVLKNMNRRTDKGQIINLIKKLRKEVPGIIIRSTFIIGFPGETEEQFNELLDFVKEVKLDKLGVFKYSREEDTKAYYMEDQIPEDIKEKRVDEIMKAQREISAKNLEKYLDKEFEVIVDEVENKVLIGRTYMDTPEIDGVVYVEGIDDRDYKPGDFVNVRIVDVLEYDMVGEIDELSK